MSIRPPTRESVRQYCIANDLFTCGCNRQYEAMFNMCDMQRPIHDIATVIWICSDEESTGKTADIIELDLLHLAEHLWGGDSDAEG